MHSVKWGMRWKFDVLLNIQGRQCRTIIRSVPQLLVSSRMKVVYNESLCETQEFTRTISLKRVLPSFPSPTSSSSNPNSAIPPVNTITSLYKIIPKNSPWINSFIKIRKTHLSLSCQARTIIPPPPPVPLTLRARVPVAHPKASLRTRWTAVARTPR